MTKAEAIEFGNLWLQMNEDCKDSSTYEFFHMAIKALEQSSKTGHWTEDGYCSCCGEDSYPYDLSGYGSYYHNYCPNCGAKMSEENNET